MKILHVLLVVLLLPLPALAAGKGVAPHLIGTFGSWRAWKTAEGDQPVCYMTLARHFPKSAGKFHRGDALLTITHRPGENTTDVFSYTAGYNYKPTSSADLHVGHGDFSLFTAQDTAWSRDAATDHKIATAIRAAPNLTITGTAAQGGAAFTDKIDLRGAAAAYAAIGKACGVESAVKPEAVKVKAKRK